MKKLILGVVLGALFISLVVYAESGMKESRDDKELAVLMIRAGIPGSLIATYLDLPKAAEFAAGDSILVIERGIYGQALKVSVQVFDTTCIFETKVLFDLTGKK